MRLKFKKIIAFITSMAITFTALPRISLPAGALEMPAFVLNAISKAEQSSAEEELPIYNEEQDASIISLDELAVGSSFDLGAQVSSPYDTAGSGFGALSYSSSNTAVCTVSNTGVVTVVGVGTSTITITAAETDDYLTATATVTINVGKDTPVFSAIPAISIAWGGTKTIIPTITSTANSGKVITDYGSITYSSSNTAVATIDAAGKITPTGIGTTTITCSIAASTKYNAATKTVSCTVNRATPTLTMTGYAGNYNVGGGTATLTTSTNSESGVTITSSNSNVISVSGKVITIKGAGTCTLTASVAQSTHYNAKSIVTGTITVSKMTGASALTAGILSTTNLSKTWSSTMNPISLVGRATIKAAANAPAPTGAVTYSIQAADQTDSSVAGCYSIAGTNLNVTKVGTYVCRATMAADANYESCSRTFTVTVGKGGQTLTAGNIVKTYQDAAFSLAGHATVTEGNGAVTYSIVSQSPNKSGGSVLSLSGNTVTILGAGSAVIKATAAATTNYNAGSVTFTLTVNRKLPVHTVENISKIYGDPAFDLAALTSTTMDEGAITYSIISGDAISISGSIVTLLKSGTVTVRASSAQTANWDAATKDFMITVGRATPIFTTTNKAIENTSDLFDLLTCITTNSDGAISFRIAEGSATDVLSINGTNASVVNSGMTTVVASIAQSDRYLATPEKSFVITVNRKQTGADPVGTPNWSTGIQKTYLDPQFNVHDYFTTASDGVITYTSANPSTLAVEQDGTATVGIAGETTVTVNIAESRNYTAYTFDIHVKVEKALPNLSAAAITKEQGTILDLNGHAITNSPGDITYTIKAGQDPDIVSITDNTATFIGYGTVIAVASIAETANFKPHSIEFNLSVTRSIPVSSAANIARDYRSGTLNLNGHAITTSNGTAAYSVVSEVGRINPSAAAVDDVIDIRDNIITVKNAGTATVRVDFAQTPQYEADSVEFTVTINPIDPNHSAADIDKTYLDPVFSLAGHLVTDSDGAVTYTSGNTNVISISGTAATINNAGSVVITATSKETQNFNEKSTTFNIVVDKAQSVITGTDHYDKLTTSADFTIDAATTSSCHMSFESSDPSIATVDHTGEVHVVAVGTATITVTLTEDSNYYGTTKEVTVTIIRDTPVLTGGNISLYYDSAAVDLLNHFNYNGDGIFTYQNYDTDIVTIANHILRVANTGTTTLTVIAPQTATWNSVQTTINITVEKASVTPGGNHYNVGADTDADDAITKTYEDPDFLLGFTTDSDGAVTYRTSDAAIATVSNTGNVHLIKSGTCTLYIDVAETRNWNAASIPITLTVNRCAVRFEHPDVINLTCTEPSIHIPVIWNSDGVYTCTSSNTNVFRVGEGDMLVIDQKGDATLTITIQQSDRYLAGSVTIPVHVEAAVPVLRILNSDLDATGTFTRRYGDPAFKLQTECSSNGTVAYATSDTLVADVNAAGEVVIKNVGTADITLSVPDTNYYKAATITYHIVVLKKKQILMGNDLSGIDKNFGDAPFTLNITTNAEDTTATYTVTPTGIISISDTGLVTILQPGEASLTVSYSETPFYESAFVTIPVRIRGLAYKFIGPDLGGINIQMGTTGRKVRVEPDLTEVDEKPDITLTYASLNEDRVRVEPDGTIIPVAVGDTYIKVTAPQCMPYVSTSVLIPITVTYKELPISSDGTIRVRYGDADFSVYPVVLDRTVTPDFTFTSSDENIVKVNESGTVTIAGIGSAIVTAHCDAIGNYGACDVHTAIIVSKGDPKLQIANMTLAKSDVDIAIQYTTLSDGEIAFELDTEGIVTLDEGKLSAVDEGTVTIKATLAATELYNGDTATFIVTVNPDRSYDVSIDSFVNVTEPKYATDLELKLTVNESEEPKTLPFTIYYLADSVQVVLYQGTITTSADAKISKSAVVNLGNITGDIILYAQLAVDHEGYDSEPSDNSKALALHIPIPEYSMTLGSIDSYYAPGQYISIPYSITGINLPVDTTVRLDMSVDGVAVSTAYANIKAAAPLATGTISGYLPTVLTDGMHTITVKLIPTTANSTDVTEDKTITVITPNADLLINNIAMEENDTFMYSTAADTFVLTISAAHEQSKVKTVLLNDKTYTVNKRSTELTLHLAESDSVELIITVESACKTLQKEYAVTVTRGSNNGAITATFKLHNGNSFEAESIEGILTFALPSDTTEGTLIINTVDSSATITRVDEDSYSANHVELGVTLSSNTDRVYIIDTTAASGATTTTRVRLTNTNYTPTVTVVNYDEVQGAIYGRNGIYSSAYMEYGPQITSVELARTAGKTHGVILDIKVADINYNQYLAGYLTVNGIRHAVHWGSFSGSTVEQAKNIQHGYVYIDSSYFTRDFELTAWTLTVCDYGEASAANAISTTTVDISFGVNVIADEFSAYYDADTSAIVLSTTGDYTYRKSLDGGITWSSSESVIGTTIPVTDVGTIIFEITLTDSIHNTFTKTVTVTKSGGTSEIQGSNVYTSTSRNADYIYINTKKSNGASISSDLLSLFGSSNE